MKHFIRFFTLSLILLLFLSCNGDSYFINEKTSEIYDLNNRCLEDGAWDKILATYGYEDSIINDNVNFKVAVNRIKDKPFDTDILYFNDENQELIAISSDRYSIRYVYNPEVSSEILDGFSKELTQSQKKRIVERVMNLVMNYQCNDGKKESLELIKGLGR